MAEIQNFGNHIGGSRADMWRAGKLLASEIDSMSDEEVMTFVTRDSLWAREKPEVAVNENGKTPALAYFQNLMRTSLPPKPLKGGKEEAKLYAETVTKIRDAVMASDTVGFVSLPDKEEPVSMKDFVLDTFTSKKSGFSYYVTINREAESAINNKFLKAAQTSPERIKREADKKNYGLTKEQAADKAAKNNYSVFMYAGIINGKDRLGNEIEPKELKRMLDGKAYFEYDQIFDKNGKRNTVIGNDGEIPARACLSVRDGWGTNFYYIYGNNTEMQPEKWNDNSFFIVNNASRSIVKINLATREEAERVAGECANIEKCLRLKDIEDKNQSKKNKGKTKFVPETLQNIERTGADDFTKGKDITGDDMVKVFGFHGGEFGNWTNQQERQMNLNMCYNALYDLTNTLKMNPADISFGGDLSIAFGARGRGNGALAHYEPVYKVINLTKETTTRKTGGAGALAHEWGHALDAKLADIAGYKCSLLSDKVEVDRYRVSKNEDVSRTALKIFDALKYKTVTEKIDYSDKIAMAEKQVTYWIDSQKPLKMDAATQKEWDDNAKEMLEKGSAYIFDFNSKSITKGLDRLSEIRKAETGHVIRKDQRDSIFYWCNELSRLRILDEKQNELGTEKRVETDFYKGSQVFDKHFSKESKGYWASLCEMFARAFDCYISDKLKEAGIRNDYLTAYADSYISTVEGVRYSAIPEGEERDNLNRLFDELVSELHEMELFHNPPTFTDHFKEKTAEMFNVGNASGFKPEDIEKCVMTYVNSKIKEYGLDAELKDVVVVGSRCRGLEKDGSDIDVVISFTGSQREDDFFNVLHDEENPLMLENIILDINPISIDKRGPLEEYLPTVEKYLEEKRNTIEQEKKAENKDIFPAGASFYQMDMFSMFPDVDNVTR